MMYPVDSKDHANCPSKYKAHLGELDFTGIDFPEKIPSIKRFERQNPRISANVFGCGKKGPRVHYITNNPAGPIKVDYLLITDPQDKVQHDCCRGSGTPAHR
jgi:hypothetical protein